MQYTNSDAEKEKERKYINRITSWHPILCSDLFFKHKGRTTTGVFVSHSLKKISIIRLYKARKDSLLLHIVFFSHHQDDQ